mmetsp:Transcript_15302/g.21301  ORF Transcript_15302/g.21301 Transcript_15302/m.21301 type:complete len:246 (-) Transcript_15302:285-1022(-)
MFLGGPTFRRTLKPSSRSQGWRCMLDQCAPTDCDYHQRNQRSMKTAFHYLDPSITIGAVPCLGRSESSTYGSSPHVCQVCPSSPPSLLDSTLVCTPAVSLAERERILERTREMMKTMLVTGRRKKKKSFHEQQKVACYHLPYLPPLGPHSPYSHLHHWLCVCVSCCCCYCYCLRPGSDSSLSCCPLLLQRMTEMMMMMMTMLLLTPASIYLEGVGKCPPPTKSSTNPRVYSFFLGTPPPPTFDVV